MSTETVHLHYEWNEDPSWDEDMTRLWEITVEVEIDDQGWSGDNWHSPRERNVDMISYGVLTYENEENSSAVMSPEQMLKCQEWLAKQDVFQDAVEKLDRSR